MTAMAIKEAYLCSRSNRYRAVLPLLWLLTLLAPACKQHAGADGLDAFSENQLTRWNRQLTSVVITDVLTPPVCSRVYAYTNIAAYEALRQGDTAYPSYSKVLNKLDNVPAPVGPRTAYYFPLSAIIAFSTVAQKLVFNGDAVASMEAEYLSKVDDYDLDDDIKQRSIAYGKAVGDRILAWAAGDGYLQRNALPAYFVNKELYRWQPTPPDYMDAVEPNWGTLRCFVLDSASQFRPQPPALFDTAAKSPYHQEVMKVYETGKAQNKEEIAAARFWDCNPNISVTQGHITFFQQKISPAGHWIYIAASVCEHENLDRVKTASIISKVAIGIADAFISCWDAKYHYNTIRPETVINKYIDKDWKPLLQTPPFPEFPSGHSVVSGASATILGRLIGDNYAYTDSTELAFGMPSRRFASFRQAAQEASMSRLYGGIHYLPSLNTGLEEGKNIGDFMLSKMGANGYP